MNLLAADNMAKTDRTATLGILLDGTDCQLSPELSNLVVNGLTNDSRKVRPGTLFFALPGHVYDGRKFVFEAVSLGAKVVISHAPIDGLESVPVILSADIRATMSRAAARFYDWPARKLSVVGVTGTNGKTTTTYLLAHIMGKDNSPWGRIGTIDYDVGSRKLAAINTTPESIELQYLLSEMVANGLSGCAMEVSSHGLVLKRCQDIEFAGAIFTNITQDHLDYHGDMETYFRAKAILFERLLRPDGFAVINADDPYASRLAELSRGTTCFYSAAENEKADVKVVDERQENGGLRFTIGFRGQSRSGWLPLVGRFNLLNAAAAVTAAVKLGVPFAEAVDRLRDAPAVPGRVQPINCGQPFEVIIDYAHTPDALKNLLLGLEAKGNKIIVFGCGGDRDKTKRPLMGEVAASLADHVFVTSDNPRTEEPARIIDDILRGIPPQTNCTVIENRDEAIGAALSIAQPNDMVIIAGKGHEDYQIIGRTKLFFSDREVVKKHLKKLGYACS